MSQMSLSIACTCRCAQPDCPTCTAFYVQNSVGLVAKLEERRASREQHNKLASVFGQIRVVSHLAHMEWAIARRELNLN